MLVSPGCWQAERLTTLVAAGANVNAVDFNGFSSILYASENGHGRSVDALIAAGADVDAVAWD